MKVAKKHIQKAAQKHIKGHQRQPSLDFSVQSSEDGRTLYFRKDLDCISQDSGNGEMSPLGLGPAAKAAIRKGAMSEPVRRAHRVKIHEPPKTKRGILARMSSNSGGIAPTAIGESFDLETSSQASCPDSPLPEVQNPFQPEQENHPKCPQSNWDDQQNNIQISEPEQSEPFEELPTGPNPDEEIALESHLPPENLSHADSIPRPQLVSLPRLEAKFSPLVPPPSPARVRRTLEAPASPHPSRPIRTKAHSHSCPRKQTTSPNTPMVNHKPAVHWQKQQVQSYGTYGNQVKPIPNNLCLSDSMSSSDGSTDSLEFVPSCLPPSGEERNGTLQREMKALFDQRMREIRCKSPLFMDGEWRKFSSYIIIANMKLC